MATTFISNTDIFLKVPCYIKECWLVIMRGSRVCFCVEIWKIFHIATCRSCLEHCNVHYEIYCFINTISDKDDEIYLQIKNMKAQKRRKYGREYLPPMSNISKNIIKSTPMGRNHTTLESTSLQIW